MKTRNSEVILKDYVNKISSMRKESHIGGDLTGWNSESKEKTLRKGT
jgi:hypothetical protein